MKSKVVLVTGGAQGIGLKLVKLLLDEGAKVYVVDRYDNDDQDGRAMQYIFDLVGNNVKEIFDDLFISAGKVDVLVNNAGIKAGASSKMLKEMGEINVDVREKLRKWVRKNNPKATILEISSEKIRSGNTPESAYFVSKLSSLLAAQEFEKTTGMQSKYAFLGPVDTDLLFTGVTDSEQIERLKSIADSPLYVAQQIVTLLNSTNRSLVYKGKEHYEMELV